jgi:hypothetical protein
MSEQNGAEPHGWLNAETLKTRVGEFEFKNGYGPTEAYFDKTWKIEDIVAV